MTPRRRVLLAGLGLALPALTVLALSLGRNPHAVRSPLVGRPAPAFALTELDGDPAQPLALAQMRGRPVVVNFWATWCVPCVAEHAVLAGAAERLGERVQFLGVVYDDREEAIRAFLAKHGSNYPTLRDIGGKTAIAYGVYGVPETFFVAPDGRIAAKFEGPLTPETLAANLEPLLAGTR